MDSQVDMDAKNPWCTNCRACAYPIVQGACAEGNLVYMDYLTEDMVRFNREGRKKPSILNLLNVFTVASSISNLVSSMIVEMSILSREMI